MFREYVAQECRKDGRFEWWLAVARVRAWMLVEELEIRQIVLGLVRRLLLLRNWILRH